MKTKEITLYTFDELSDDAKEKALEHFRTVNVDFEWWDAVYDDAERIGAILGVEIDRIYFSGFWSQGDGACFDGSYCYAKGSCKEIRSYAPLDTELHEIADRLFDAQRPNFYGVMAWAKHSGRYYHEMCTGIRVEHNYNSVTVDDRTAENVKESLRDFMRWIYRSLEREFEWRTSDEAVTEFIQANEYEFTQKGEVA